VSRGQEAAKRTISLEVFRQKYRPTVVGAKLGPHNGTNTFFSGYLQKPNQSVEPVGIGYRQRRHVERFGGRNELLETTYPSRKRKTRMDVEMNKHEPRAHTSLACL
jgi:hypothetical protein